MTSPTRTMPRKGGRQGSPTSRPRQRRWWKRIAAAVLFLIVVGMVAQVVLDWQDRRNNPAPGELVELSDGRRIHFQLTGLGNNGPMVILEAGAGSFSTQWSWVQGQVSEYAPVLSYDRAGLGWSDDPAESRAADAVAVDLAELLEELDLNGPYVLVGHSYGAVFNRMFAERHPEKVAGLVLVDPAHEEQFERFPAMGDTTAPNVMRILSRVGFLRLLRPFDLIGEDMSPEAFEQWRSVAYSTRYADAQAREASYLVDEVSPWFAERGSHLGDTPLTVIQAADAKWPDAGMQDLQFELQELSTDSQFQVVEGADHFSIVTNERNASAVTAAIAEIIRYREG